MLFISVNLPSFVFDLKHRTIFSPLFSEYDVYLLPSILSLILFGLNFLTNLFIIFILVIVLFIYYEKKNNGLIYVKSSLDNKEYLVRNVDDKQNAADLLADMKERISKLLIHMQATYPSDPRIKRLVKKFNPNNISESIEGSKYTSYSLNKGEKIVLCLRSKTKEGRLTDINTIMFVTLHELAHIMTVSIGHTKEFWSNFKFILKMQLK